MLLMPFAFGMGINAFCFGRVGEVEVDVAGLSFKEDPSAKTPPFVEDAVIFSTSAA